MSTVEHRPELMTLQEAALELRVSVQTARRYVRQGRLPHVRTPGGNIRIPLAALPALQRSHVSGRPAA